ncbi:MAG: 23S rRNA (adenine(2503)-C(2))-methyltransferase RlmN [Patescibacteria group bacterium]|nr:23S rRNA (adenine(2503)-C(2))-methyltransferase RlmN [Patescibacteria group bacterium]MBU1877251.1 23S rRNA (adenine(2503)-C(2))-methyltransferase RlmN [Patescibacteria group bacterium]
MDIEKLKKILEDRGEPKYRFSQIYKAVFFDLIFDFSQMTNLSKELREILSKEITPFSLKIKTIQKGKEVDKDLFELEDGNCIETVLMKHNYDRKTVCISSQVGCPLGCKFCATGKMGFIRNLDSQEIVDQVLFFAKEEKDKKLNVVFMGMGEPLLNYDNVLQAIRVLNDKNGFNLSIRSISISTAGIIPGIKKLMNENLQLNLAISLNSPNEKQRTEIMPVNQQYSLKELMAVAKEYVKKTNKKLFFEYVLLDGINDDLESSKQLIKLLDKEPLFHINLIRYNNTSTQFRSSSIKTIEKFKKELEKNNINVTLRYSFGKEIKAACGQLSTTSNCFNVD